VLGSSRICRSTGFAAFPICSCLLVLLLLSCSGVGPKDFPNCELSAVGSDGRPRITVFFSTNRLPAGQIATDPTFGVERANEITYGKAVVSLPSNDEREFGRIVGFRILTTELFQEDSAFADALRAAARAQQARFGTSQDLVFVHGYNESFERVVFRVAQMAHDGCLRAVPIVFAWPSRDSLLAYLYDVDSATYSRWDLAHVLDLVRDHSGFDVTHVMAHSMGNWVTLEALRLMPPQAKTDAERISPRRFGTIILASPDMDLDIFRRELPTAMDAAEKVVLLASQRDFLIRVSGFLSDDSPRAGGASTDELTRHRIQMESNFSIVRMDGPEIASCADGSHRCAETNAQILRQIDLIMEESKDLARIRRDIRIPSTGNHAPTL